MKPKILFVFDHEYEDIWKDGLWAALELLKKDFEVRKWNLTTVHNGQHFINLDNTEDLSWVNFILGWGGFNSKVDQLLQSLPREVKKGLCLGGYAQPTAPQNYGVLFYETEWSKEWFSKDYHHGNLVHAFGVNTDIYKPLEEECFDDHGFPVQHEYLGLWDYLTVGSFSSWKRQLKILGKQGSKFAVGQIQKGNMVESIDIVGNLILGGCGVSDMVPPEDLAKFYNLARTVYIPADVMGGGERAVLEARACEVAVEVEPDNPKLLELTTSPIWDHHYYAAQLKKSIDAVLRERRVA